MGWKLLKERYRIGHIVQIREGALCIGSPYIHDLIKIVDGKPTWGNLGPSKNDDLARYFDEMSADINSLHRIIDEPDWFDVFTPVYTWDGGEIIEKLCEEHGWPNVTHDGQLMYENSFSTDRAKVVEWAKESARYSVEWRKERLEEALTDLVQRKVWLTEAG